MMKLSLTKPLVANVLVAIFLHGLVPDTKADLKLAAIFGDRMVLQRDQPVAVWGWADAGQMVTVRFGGQTVKAKTDDAGAWRMKLEPLETSIRGRPMLVQSPGASLTIRDILVGDVWHASGQSNMGFSLNAVARRLAATRQDIEEANHPHLRFRQIRDGAATNPRQDLQSRASWVTCSPVTAGNFSAVAFYFALELRQKLGVPIGIIDTSRGGTPIEPYIPREAFDAHPTLVRIRELGDREKLRELWMLPGGVRARDAHWLPGRLFNSRLAPISAYTVRGVIWYQGESNCGDREDPREYRHKMRALINGWRQAFGREALPFYYVQLPGSGARAGWPYLREQQRLSMGLPHTGMAVTIDLLDKDIHPVNKYDVGKRLARWALADTYGRKIEPSGPLFDKAVFGRGTALVSFQNTENGMRIARKVGLAAPNEEVNLELAHFELADAEGHWHPAKATIQGARILVRNNDIPNPKAVRYAYAVDPQQCYLYSPEGLPASPFCSHPELLDHDPNLPKE